MAEAESTSESGSGRKTARVRTAGEGSPGGPPARPAGGSRGRGRGPRPKAGQTGATARLLAPLALVICSIAVFSVLSAGGSETATRGGSDSTQSSSSKDSGDSTSGGSGDASDSGSTGPTRATYRVKPGDSFAAIAEKTGVDVDTLAELNPDVDPRALQPGQKLKLK